MRQLVALVFLLATAAIRAGAEELVQAEPAIYRTNDAVESNVIRRLLEAKRPCEHRCHGIGCCTMFERCCPDGGCCPRFYFCHQIGDRKKYGCCHEGEHCN